MPSRPKLSSFRKEQSFHHVGNVCYDTDGPTLLYKTIEQRQWASALSRIHHCPVEASTWIFKLDSASPTSKTTGIALRWKILPIHQACQREPPPSVVHALLEAYPDGAAQPSHTGSLPVHYAAHWNANVHVLRLLLLAYPQGLNAVDSCGLTPLQIVQNMPRPDNCPIVEALSKPVEYYENMDDKGRSLIQLAAERSRSDVLESMSTDGDGDVAAQTTDGDAKAAGGAASKEAVAKRKSIERDESEVGWQKAGLVIVVVGASGDLAKRKIYPSLLNLYEDDLLPEGTIVWGYARTKQTADGLRAKLKPFLDETHHKEAVVQEFLSNCFYQSCNGYDDVDAMGTMVKQIEDHEERSTLVDHNRLFYFAIPPTVFAETGTAIRQTAMATRGWTRIIVEKPFGRDLASYEQLSKSLSRQFNEDTLYRIDHYLGKEMVQNLLILRFGNLFFERLWSRDDVQCVILTFKEPFGTDGRGGYFDQFGIIRDILQNHLLQVLTLLAMEPPVKLNGPEASQKVRDQKVQVLNAMSPIKLEDCVLGQYEGYTDDPTIENKESNTPTYAAILVRIHTPRWEGVPFILKAGKAVDERKAEMRIQFKDAPAAEFLFDCDCPRNELVIRMQPKEAIYLKTNVKSPGFASHPVQGELEVNYDTRYFNRATESNPDAYTRLILDVLRGRQAAFVRDDELKRSWEIFTPLLHRIENEDIAPIIYKKGTRGPEEADDFIAEKCGFKRNADYAVNYSSNL